MDRPILEMRGIHKRFPGVYALRNVSFAVRQGTVHGIVGENGAGKSTLMRILSGASLADEGEVLIDGSYRQRAVSRSDAAARGRRNLPGAGASSASYCR